MAFTLLWESLWPPVIVLIWIFLKPMARFHLPFASMEETIIRSLSFYLTRQFFNSKRGEESDFDLNGFCRMYDDIKKVNEGILQRIRSISKKDANANGLIILDAFTTVLSSSLTDNFEKLEKYFPKLKKQIIKKK